MNIPKDWTFKSREVVDNFDAHVREQLPWYDLATQAVVHIGRHYIPKNGLVYDVGASTGNIGYGLSDIIIKRNARFVAVEESEEMAKRYKGPPVLCIQSALEYEFRPFDFAVAFLCVMFMPVNERVKWLNKMWGLIKPGGAFVIVDKIITPAGYAGTVLRRMAMSWKLQAGAQPHEILEKELSLAGYQRPLSKEIMDNLNGELFFQFGEFAGWIIEKQES